MGSSSSNSFAKGLESFATDSETMSTDLSQLVYNIIKTKSDVSSEYLLDRASTQKITQKYSFQGNQRTP